MLRNHTYEEIGNALGRTRDSVKRRIANAKKKPLPFAKNTLVIGDLHAPFVKTGYLVLQRGVQKI